MTKTIGLLGGSFNPAHEGHLYISRYALDKLGMDEVWWLVSPVNPLKDPKSLAAYRTRLTLARDKAAGEKRIRVLDIEARKKFFYSVETIDYLRDRHPNSAFVWLMGADNLAQFHRWKRWRYIMATLPVIVFDRSPYSHSALRSPAAHHARKLLLKNSLLKEGTAMPPLRFIRLRRDPHSSTEIRKKLGKRAFLRHN